MENLSKESLPLGWELQLYKDVVETISTNGKKVNQKQYENSGTYPIFDQGQSYCSGYLSDENKVINAKFPVLVFGDHTRAVKYVKEPFVAGADGVKVLEPNGKIIPELLLYFTQYLAVAIKDKGYARHYQWVAKEHIGIPPLQEQRRIVEKIEELFSELDSGIKSLTRAKQQIAVYRQALLKQAFVGKLTAQWREDNPDKLDSLDGILEGVKLERDARYEQKLEHWKADVIAWERNGSNGKKPLKPKKGKLFSDVLPKSLSSLPQSWQWERLGNLIDGTPQNGIYKPASDYGKGTYIVRIDDFYDGRLIKKSNFKRLSLDDEDLKKYQVEPNDVLVNRVNSIEYLGKCCSMPDDINESIVFESNIMKFKVLRRFLNENYLTKFISSHVGKGLICSNAKHAVNQASINQTDVGMTPIPLCSIAEQEQINEKLDEKLSLMDIALQNIDMNLKKTELLRQSILKRAFSGQLVSQDPEDEPAIELLKKIALEKEELAEKEKSDC